MPALPSTAAAAGLLTASEAGSLLRKRFRNSKRTLDLTGYSSSSGGGGGDLTFDLSRGTGGKSGKISSAIGGLFSATAGPLLPDNLAFKPFNKMWRSQSTDGDGGGGAEDGGAGGGGGSTGPDAADAMAQICKSSVLLASTEVNSCSPLRQRQFLKKSLNSLLSPRRRVKGGGLSHQPASIDESVLEDNNEAPPSVKFHSSGRLSSSSSMRALNKANGEEATSPVCTFYIHFV